MVRLYLDLETYRPKNEDAFVNERIILAGLMIDETPYHKDGLEKDIDTALFKEWGGLDERAIVSSLYDKVKVALTTHKFTVICGFNILRFDIPMLVLKAVNYGLDKHDELAKMWNNTFTIDYLQQLLPANNNQFKGMKLKTIVDIAERFKLNPPKLDTTGGSIKELYEQGKHKEIEDHIIQDLKVIRWLDLFGAKCLITKSIERNQPLFKLD